MSGPEQSLLEAVADIAYIAGQQGYYSGDSRADVATFISWAQEFETHRSEDAAGNELYFGDDYMSAIETFALAKMGITKPHNRWPSP